MFSMTEIKVYNGITIRHNGQNQYIWLCFYDSDFVPDRGLNEGVSPVTSIKVAYLDNKNHLFIIKSNFEIFY